jgi:glycosyltransferase involved in cell wall biosynthesis
MGGEGVLGDMLHNAGIRTITLYEMQNKLSLREARSAASELRRVLKIERPDVLHVNSSTAGLIGAVIGHTTRVPNIIFTAHGWAFNEDRPLSQRLILKALHYLTVLLSDRTIAVSRAIVTQMNWPFAQRKMKVINPGRTIGVTYSHDEAREKLIGFCPELAAYQNDYWIVCLAELHPIKRHLVLLDAFRQLPQTDTPTRLILIGEGSERERIEIYIATHHLAGRVIVTGSITEAARFLKAFDLFVLASKSESYGYVLHEAGLAGVPVIATNVGGIPDIIENHNTGVLVPPDNAPALTTAIHILQTNPTQTAAYAAALKTELSNRSVVKMTRQTESLY